MSQSDRPEIEVDIPQSLRQLSEAEREVIKMLAGMTKDDVLVMKGQVKNTQMWLHFFKKVKFFSSIILGLSGLVAAIVYLIQQTSGLSK